MTRPAASVIARHILPPLSSPCAFIPAMKKFGVRFKNFTISMFYFLKNCVSGIA